MDLKDKIIDSTEQVLLTKGLAKTTTKEIAREAGCSEGSIYNHFKSKEDIFLLVLQGKLKNLMRVLVVLPDLVGKETVKSNLTKVALASLEDYNQSMPIICSIFSEPTILLRHREGFEQRNENPHITNEIVADYLSNEKKIGRVSENLQPRAVSDLLIGGCFQRSFQLNFSGDKETYEDQIKYINDILDVLLPEW